MLKATIPQQYNGKRLLACSGVNSSTYTMSRNGCMAILLNRRHRHNGNAILNGDIEFLESLFHRLLINFTWWVNRKDAEDNNIFEGGFLGLDNIGAFDRNMPLPDSMVLEQTDGTAWMGLYCLTMLRMAMELATVN